MFININVTFVTVVLLTAFLSFLYGSSKDNRYLPAWWCILALAMGTHSYLLDSLLRDTSLTEWSFGIVFGTLGMILIMVLSYKIGVVHLKRNELKSTAKKMPLSLEDQELFDKAQELAKKLVEAVEKSGHPPAYYQIDGKRVYVTSAKYTDNYFIVIGDGIIGRTQLPKHPPVEYFDRDEVEFAVKVLEHMLGFFLEK